MNHGTVSKDAQREVFTSVVVFFALLQAVAFMAYVWFNNKQLHDLHNPKPDQWMVVATESAGLALPFIWDVEIS